MHRVTGFLIWGLLAFLIMTAGITIFDGIIDFMGY